MKPIKAILKSIRNLLLIDVLLHPDARPIIAWGLAWILFGTVLFHWLEGWGWIDSFYFTIVSLTTVGYGDLAPTTPASKLIASFFLLNGVAILLALLDQVRKVRGAKLSNKVEELRNVEAKV